MYLLPCLPEKWFTKMDFIIFWKMTRGIIGENVLFYSVNFLSSYFANLVTVFLP